MLLLEEMLNKSAKKIESFFGYATQHSNRRNGMPDCVLHILIYNLVASRFHHFQQKCALKVDGIYA